MTSTIAACQHLAVTNGDGDWITATQAASLTGLTAAVIAHASRAGLIELRPKPRKGRPSLARTSVVAFADRRRRAEEAREHERLRARRSREAAYAAPHDEHDWLTVSQVAHLMGRSRSGIGLMIREERIPATKVGRRWWIRRDHVERIRAAELFKERVLNGGL